MLNKESHSLVQYLKFKIRGYLLGRWRCSVCSAQKQIGRSSAGLERSTKRSLSVPPLTHLAPSFVFEWLLSVCKRWSKTCGGCELCGDSNRRRGAADEPTPAHWNSSELPEGGATARIHQQTLQFVLSVVFYQRKYKYYWNNDPVLGLTIVCLVFI